MMKIEIRKARKNYECDYSGKHIGIGTNYKRINVKNVGVFHFAMDVHNKDIRNFVSGKDDNIRRLDEEYAYEDYDDGVQ